jgi:acyl-CoA thioester hydrolase
MAQWQEISRNMVFPWHCDHYGHMNVRWYTHFFDDASFLIWSTIGFNMRDVLATGIHTVIARSTTEYHREVRAGDPVLILGGFTRIGTKSLTLCTRMLDANTRELRATNEYVVVFFNAQTRRSAEIPGDVRHAASQALVTDRDPH